MNFLEKASKNRVPVAYAVRGFFSVRHRSKRKFLSDQIGRVIDGRKISAPPELKNLQRRVSKTAFSVGLNRGMF